MDEKLRYRKYMREHRPAIVGLSVLACIISLLVVAFAYLTKLLLDYVGARRKFIILAIVTGVLLLVEVGCKFLYAYLLNKFKIKAENAVKKQAFCSFLNKDYREAEQLEDADAIMRLTSDCKVVADGVITYVPEFVGLLSRIVSALAVLFFVDVFFAAGLLCLGVVVYFATKLLRRHNKTLHKDSQTAEGEVLSFYKEGVSHSFLFKLFGNGKQVEKRCDVIQEKYQTARMRYARFNIFINSGFLLFMRLSYLFAILWTATAIAKGGSIGNLFAIIQLIAQIEGPFGSISGLLPKYYRTLGSVERLLDMESATAMPQTEVGEFDAPILVERLSFGYSDSETQFSGVSLTINPNDFIAIVGRSGGGKSTFLKCVMGMYKPRSGSVTFKGQDISSCQSLFSYVPQGNFLIPGTIADNLLMFSPEATNEDMERVLSLTMLKEKIDSLPEGLNTAVSDFGAGLSEGEGQRLSIARALLVNRPVLVLDECTSALDEVTEKAILQNITSLGKTVLLVSHKPCAVKYADKVFRLNNEEDCI